MCDCATPPHPHIIHASVPLRIVGPVGQSAVRDSTESFPGGGEQVSA